MIKRITSAAIVLISLCLIVRSQAQSPAAKTPDEPTKGSISGKVVNESGQPMAGVPAFVRPINSVTGGRTLTTDAEGSFQVNNLDPGLYIVGANAPAYTSTPADPNAPAYYRIGDTVNLQLVRGGVITGTVTNAFGEPLVAVRVRATRIRKPGDQTPLLPFVYSNEQSTDDRGIYRIYGLIPGTYIVSAGGYSSAQFQFNPYESDVPTYAPSATRDDAAEVSVRAGEQSEIDIRYRGESGHSISGTVKVGSGGGASVSLTSAGNLAMPSSNTFQAPGGRGFAFHGLSDGEYDLMAQEFVQNPNPTMSMMMVSEAKRVIVKGANVTGIELIPRSLASISGRIVFETSKAPECQGKRPPLLAETLVQLRRPEKDGDKENSPPPRSFGSSGSPDSKGAFMLRNLSPGKYQFDPRFYARYWFLQSITLGTAAAAASGPKSQTARLFDAAANWTDIKSGDQLTNLTVALAEGAASIRGKSNVADPPVETSLFLVPAEPAKADEVLRFFMTKIAADGTFAFNNLPPGRYWLLTQTNVDAHLTTMVKLRQPDAATARIKLRRSAETQKTEIELRPCQNLTDYQLKQ